MILILGPGAVGTILAAHLVAARQSVNLYIRPKDLEKFSQAPQLQVDRASGGKPLVAAKPVLTDALDLTGIEYLFLCVKFPDLDGVLESLPQPLPPHLTLVSTLNGLAALHRIRARFPQQPVVPMSVMFNGQLLGPLHARITTAAQVIVGSDDARLLGLFGGSGMKVKRAHGESAAWGKLLINLANGICALTHTTFKDLLTLPAMRAVYVATLDEAVGVLEASGTPFHLPIPMPHRLYRQLLLRGGPLPWWFARLRNRLQEGSYPSMVADVAAGRRTEIAQLNGEIVALAEKIGAPAPVNRRIVELVQGLAGQAPPPYLTPAQLRQQLGV